MLASASARLARTIRCATVDSGDEERARDRRRGEAAEHAQRQRDPGLGGEHRVAAGEDQREDVVADLVVERAASSIAMLHVRARSRAPPACAPAAGAAHQVDRAVLRRGHQPGARVVRDARLAATSPARRRARPARGPRRARRRAPSARARRSAGRTRSARPPRSRAASPPRVTPTSGAAGPARAAPRPGCPRGSPTAPRSGGPRRSRGRRAGPAWPTRPPPRGPWPG